MMNQIPGFTETLLAAGDYAGFEWLIKRYAVRKEVLTPEVMERWKENLRKSGLRGGVNYYIWGEVDRALERELGYSIENHTSGGFDFHLVKGSGHWVQQEAADEVNEQLTDFLGIH